MQSIIGKAVENGFRIMEYTNVSLNAKAARDLPQQGKIRVMLLSDGQTSDQKGAPLMLDATVLMT